MKKIFSVCALCVGLFAGVIKVGISPDYPPFEYMENGEITGFDHDLVVEIGKVLGDEIKFVPLNFDGLVAALKTGKIDMIASGMTKTKEREKSCEFSQTYYDSVTYYVKLKNRDDISGVNDLNGKKVGAQIGTIQAIEAAKINGVKMTLNADPIVFVTGTLKGKVDAFAIDSVVAKEYMKKYNEFEVFAKTKPGDNSSFNMAFKKGNTELRDRVDSALTTLKENGVYAKLLKKYELEE